MLENSNTVRDAASNKKDTSLSFNRKYNIIPKILCILAAFVMWIYVMQTESPEYEELITSVSVDMINTTELQNSSGLSVYSRSGNTVNVKVRGKKSSIDRLSAEDISAYVDLGKIKMPGQHALSVYVDLPDGVNLVEPQPSSISVYVDETDTVSLNVSEKLENFVLTSPYELGEIKFEYDTITVTGPKNKLSQILAAQVNINMLDKTSSFVTKCPVSLINDNGEKIDTSYISMSVNEMSVTVPIYVTKEIPVDTSFKYGFLNSDNSRVTVTPETITVRGDENKLTDLTGIIEKIEIDEKQITESPYTMTVMCKPLADVFVDEADTEVKITVELDSSLKTKKFISSNIDVTGADEKLSYEVVDKYATVTLRGTAEALGKIKTSDISILVDLSGYDSGSSGTVFKTATIVIDSEYADEVYELGSYSVQVKLNNND